MIIVPLWRQRGNKRLGWFYTSLVVFCDLMALFLPGLDTNVRWQMFLGCSVVWGAFALYCFSKPKSRL